MVVLFIRTCIFTAMVNEDDISDPSGLVKTSFVKFMEHALKTIILPLYYYKHHKYINFFVYYRTKREGNACTLLPSDEY